MSKVLVILGVILVIAGLLWPLLSRLPLGRLPGDLVIQKKNFTFYFPLVTSILLSMILSVLMWIFSKWFH